MSDAPGRLVTVASFDRGIDAHMARACLKQEGIECYLADEHVVSLGPHYSNVIGGVKLQVKQADVPTAVELLQESHYLSPPGERRATQAAGQTAPASVRCPECGSKDARLGNLWAMRFLALLTFVGPGTSLRTKYTCKACGWQWQVERRRTSHGREERK